MGQITSGIGLISGIPIASLIDQLIAIAARPKNIVQRRNAVLNSQQVAFQDINAKLLVLKLAADQLARTTTFTATTATSSNPDVLTLSSGSSTIPGIYSFTVDRLVSSQQIITRGFADSDASPIAPSGGTITFEFGDGRLDSNTELERLNGSAGVNRGKIRITDRSGVTSIVDLSKALTVNDVLDAINNDAVVDVTARVVGDQFVIDDNTGQTTTSLSISDVGATGTATGLGLAQTAAGNTLTGNAINTVSVNTSLSVLNDSNGVRALGVQQDFQISLRDGSSFNVVVGGTLTLGDVIDTINAASGGTVIASINDAGTGLKLVDATAGASTFQVTALNGSGAAADLGILFQDVDDDGTIDGDRLIAALNSKLLKNVRGGTGVLYAASLGPSVLTGTTLLTDLLNGAGSGSNGNPLAPDLQIAARDSALLFNIEVDTLTTVQDLIDEVASVTGGKVTMAIEGRQLRVSDNTGGGLELKVLDASGSTMATTLGIDITDFVDSVLSLDLQPTALPTGGFGPGQINITNRDGVLTSVDLGTARSITDVIKLINDAGAGVTVALNNAGNGLTLIDTTGGSNDLIIADTGTGDVAAQLGLAGTYTQSQADSGNIQIRYVSEATRLDALNGGKGIASGKFSITSSTGVTQTVDLTQGNEVTVADVIAEINSRFSDGSVVARINDNGDGLLIQDLGPGTVKLEIREEGSTTARDLGILGEAENIGDDIDGSFEKTLTVDAADTLEDLIDKINDAGLDVRATFINDGSSGSPYRLSLLASQEGKAGAFVFDDGGLGFGAFTLTEARDAVVFFGSDDPAKAIAITSSSNTLDKVIPAATITLSGTSDSPVQAVINLDDESIVSTASRFVDDFNKVIETLDKYDKFDSDTLERGLLLGDVTVSHVRSAVYRLINRRLGDITSQFNALSQVGVTVGTGAKLEFDETKFRAALDNDRDAIKRFFTFTETQTDEESGDTTTTAIGIAARIAEILDGLTRIDGTIQRRLDTIDDQVELNKKRIDQLDDLLAIKRARLEFQFNAMERALALLQSQSSALVGLQPLLLRSRS